MNIRDPQAYDALRIYPETLMQVIKAAAVPAGFFAGWPVNYLLLKHELKAGH